MSFKRGPETPWYVRRLLTPVSAGLPKAIGIDEIYPKDGVPHRILFAVMCNDMSTGKYRNFGGKNHGAGIHLDEIPATNFRYVFIGDEHIRAAEKIYTPASRYEHSLNGKFYGDSAQVDATAIMLARVMDIGRDMVHVDGYNRAGQIRRGIAAKVSRLSGTDVGLGHIECRPGADTSIPIVRGADELGHDVRRIFGNDIDNFFAAYPGQMIEFTPDNMIELNLTRHEQRLHRFEPESAAA